MVILNFPMFTLPSATSIAGVSGVLIILIMVGFGAGVGLGDSLVHVDSKSSSVVCLRYCIFSELLFLFGGWLINQFFVSECFFLLIFLDYAAI